MVGENFKQSNTDKHQNLFMDIQFYKILLPEKLN